MDQIHHTAIEKKDRVEVASDVARKLHDAEAAIDIAIAKSARLIDGLMRARATMHVSTIVGGESADRLSLALAGLMTARRETAAAHGALTVVQGQLGLDRVRLDDGDPNGPYDKPPPPTGVLEPSAEVRPLRRA